jgi:catechol 2,3-dioxygenase-like lactoylglutathione lyase family enzyme
MNRDKHYCDHVALFTQDAERLASFYVEKMDFRKENEEMLPSDLAKAVFGIEDACKFIRLVAGQVKLELFQPLSLELQTRAGRAAGYHHWGYCVDDRKTFCHKLRQKHVTVIEVKRPTHIVYFAEDPDGNRIEIRDTRRISTQSS